MAIQEKIGKRIAQLRKEKLKLSQQKFAYEAEVALQSVVFDSLA